MDVRVADDSPPTGRLHPSGLELGLDQDHQGRARGHRRTDQHRHGPGDGDEREVGCHQVHRDPTDGVECDLADVEALAAIHPGVVPQPGMKLAPAHVDCHHGGGAGLEETVGEPAGRGAGIERPGAGHLDVEPLQGGLQFVAASAHVAG